MACKVAEELVIDRLAEFRRLARNKGNLPKEMKPSLATPSDASKDTKVGKLGLLHHREAGAKGDVEAGFMQEFFDDIGKIESTVKLGNEEVQQMEGLIGELLHATSQDAQASVSGRLDELSESTRGHIAASKQALDALQAQMDADNKSKPSFAHRQIQTNMQRSVVCKHQQLLKDFQKVQLDIKGALEQRQFTEMQLLCPEATGEQIREMIDAGETSSQMMVRRMAGAHASILEEVQRIRDKHQDILKMEKSIQDLAQMVQEMAVLVDAQGELLDNIEANVHATNEYTGKGAKELDKALKIQTNTRKWQCCLSCFLMTVALVVTGPMILKLT